MTHALPGPVAPWFVGHRPPPGYCEEQDQRYFKAAVESGLITQRQAYDLLERHRRLTIAENGGAVDLGIPAELEAQLIRRGWTPPGGSK